MTQLDLDAIEARAKAATKGSWWWPDDGSALIGRARGADDEWIDTTVIVADLDNVVIEPEDAEFIAHARTDIPALIARIREICPHYSWSGQEGPEPETTAWKCDSCGLVTHDPNEIEEDHL
jgi:hypothetical protein